MNANRPAYESSSKILAARAGKAGEKNRIRKTDSSSPAGDGGGGGKGGLAAKIFPELPQVSLLAGYLTPMTRSLYHGFSRLYAQM